MQNLVIRLALLITLFLMCISTNAQDKGNTIEIDSLRRIRMNVETQEKELLKISLEELQQKLKAKKISTVEFEQEKKSLAELHAKNIQSRTSIIDEMIDYLKRNENVNLSSQFKLPYELNEESRLNTIKKDTTRNIYFIKEYIQPYIGVGFSNAVRNNSFSDMPYKLSGSRYFELGIDYRHAFKKKGSLHLRYGIGLQIDGYKLPDNQYYVIDDKQVSIEQHPYKLKKSKFRRTDLIVPLHIEFQKLKGTKRKNGGVHYRYRDSWNFGVGGYAGVNLESMQILKYKDGSKNYRTKQSFSSGVNHTIYGLSAYVGKNTFKVYARYALSEMFKNNVPNAENTLAIGVRYSHW